VIVNILDAASDDIYDGYCFYEKRQSGLGAYFYSAVKDEIVCTYIMGMGTYKIPVKVTVNIVKSL